MWSIRILSGNQKGQSFQLKAGRNIIGRMPNCDIVLTAQGISKEHAQIEVQSNGFLITDIGSRNGTFVNGVQIRHKEIQPGERVSVYDVIFDIVPTAKLQNRTNAPTVRGAPPQLQNDVFAQAANAYQGNLAISNQPQAVAYDPQGDLHQDMAQPDQHESKQEEPKSLKDYAVKYMNEVILPGNYKLAETFEFKTLIALFCAVFVITVTSLSTIPLTQILKYRLEKTSQQRAMSIARNLALSNRASLASGLTTGININAANKEPGVDKAYVVDNDGRILAPKALAQQYPEIPFIHSARRVGKEAVQQIDDSTIGALAPIELQNPQTGVVAPMAYAVIIYDMGTLAVDDSQTLALFIKTLFIALVVGALIFFFLFKIVEYPIVALDKQISEALRNNNGQLQLNYKFDHLQSLIDKVNSLMERGLSSSSFDGPSSYEHERSGEAYGLLQLIGFPAVAIDAEKMSVMSVNPQFNEQIAKGAEWDGLAINDILDQALKLNLKEIVERAFSTPNSIATDEIDIEGVNYDISGQAVFGLKEVNYVIVSFTPRYE